MVEKVKNTRMNPAQHKRQQAGTSGAIDGPVRQLGHRRKVHAERKQPQQVESPEQRSRHRTVVARITQVQKAQELFVDDVKPEEAVILARPAVHREGEDMEDCVASPARATEGQSPTLSRLR